jgi:DNA topoisomerase II
MTKDKEPEILPLLPEESEFTKITFQPDLAKFKMTELDDGIISVMARRAYDVAGTTGIKVF